MFFYSREIVVLWNAIVSLCCDDGWLPDVEWRVLAKTIPPNLLVRIGLRLTHSFVWSGDTLKAQQDLSVKLRITIQWCSCLTSMPHTGTSPQIRVSNLNHVTFNNHHISEHTCERRISWLSLWKLLHICTLFIEYARVFHLNLWAPGEEQTPGAFSTQNLICVSEALADAERSSALQSQEKDILWFTALCPQKHLPGAAEMPKNEYDSPPNDSVRWLHSVKWTLKQNLKKVLVNIF